MKKLACTLSLLLAVNTIASPFVSYATTDVTSEEENLITDSTPQKDTSLTEKPFELPDIVDAEEAAEHGYIGRMYEDEKDLNTFVFQNEDGTSTMRVYSHPVKYTDENNEVQDISLDIKENTDGSFSTAEHEIITTFEKDLSDGIRLSYDDLEIKMVPEMETNDTVTASSDDTESVEYIVDDITSYVYELTYSGFKEDIVVAEYTGQTEYDFTLYTNGLTLCEESGSYYLKDDSGEIKATIGDIIVFTADERNNTFGTMTYETVTDNEEYLLTIHLDAEYLQDEETVYPIRIDPTVEVNYSNDGTDAIRDVTINSAGTSDGTSGSLYVGKRSSYGISRVLMSFPGLDLTNINSARNVVSASVEIRDLMCESESLTIECHLFEGSSWTESSATWSNVNPNKYSSLLSTKTISYSNGENQSTAHRYSFNITNAVTKWVEGTFSKTKGIIFKARDAIENGSTYISKTFASYNRTSYKPSLTVTYRAGILRSEFYSKYKPGKFNLFYGLKDGEETDLIQFRMNCYGYAFCNILNGKAICSGDSYDSMVGYRQQPGEFVSTASRSNAKSLQVYNAPTTLMNNIVSNLKLDAERFGYTITECPLTSSTAAQYGVSSRLIAVVTGNYDYHFYMQHNDGTWSHKPGSREVTNLSLEEDDEDKVILTNENIYYEANQGAYENGELKFFLITKSAVMDQPHTSHCCIYFPDCLHTTQITLKSLEEAGDYLETSVSISAGSTSARIDFTEDHDVYYFTATSTKTYTITTTCSASANLNCIVYDNNNPTVIGTDTNSGQVNLSVSLSAGSQYYIEIYNENGTCVNYTLKIS